MTCATRSPDHPGRWCTEPAGHAPPHRSVNATLGTVEWGGQQGSLFDVPPPVVQIDSRGLTIQEAFDAFHAANPWVADWLERRALALLDRGYEKWGIKSLAEVLRWEIAFAARDAHGFKLNNNYTSRYARLVMERQPRLKGFFETREIRSR